MSQSLFADIPTRDRMIVFCFNVPLMEMVMFRFIASTAISEHSSARYSVRRAICRLLTICDARCLFRSYGFLEVRLKFSEVPGMTREVWMKFQFYQMIVNVGKALV
jgi:hypothetical protein